MRFNVVTSERGYDIVKKEFPKDNVIIFDYGIFGKMLDNISVVEDNTLYYKLLKFFLMKKYKNLVFIDFPNAYPIKGLRDEIVTLSKSKVSLFYLNEKLDFFYSKKCPSYIEDVLSGFSIIGEVKLIETISFFMKPATRQIELSKLYFYDGLKIYMELFQYRSNILLLDLEKKPFDPKDYRKYVKDDDTFLICYNAPKYVPGWNYGSDIKNIVIIDFDVNLLPLKYDTLKKYTNIKTERTYTGYFSEFKSKKII